MPRLGRIVHLAALLVAGCQNQPTTFNNPFLSPDRVPPPSTRVLTPGAAQPYYPGDPSMGGAAPSYTPAPAVGTPAPAAQPGGWNSNQTAPPATGSPYTPTSSTGQLPAEGVSLAGADGDVVRVPDDGGQLRFAGNQLGAQPARPPVTPTPIASTPATPPPSAPGVGGAVQQASAVLPAPRSAADFPANSSVSMAAYQTTPQEVRLREVDASGNPQSGQLSAPDLFASIDGFRPQGSRRRTLDESTTRPTFDAGAASRERFGYDLQYQWLRGQLEQDPATGQWRVRYQRADDQPDQFGGSVFIANPQLLGNLPPGTFVVLRGQLHNLHFPDGRTAPAYQLTVVQRQLQ